jgi:hypothetical protein
VPRLVVLGLAALRIVHQHFGGGFVVSKRMCAHLEVSLTGRADPIPLAVPFGAAC